MTRVRLDDQGRATQLKVYWSKREKALVYDGEKCTGGLVAGMFEGALTSQGTQLVKELAARGYDITTLRLSIERKLP